MPYNVMLEKMTWPDVRKALDSGYTTAIFACGAIEQHGPHLPLFVDAEHGTRLSEEVALRLGKSLVAPTIRVGCSEHHMAFPGTISLQRSTLEALCRDYCTSLARHGFLRICIISSHGGNMAPLADMLDRLRDSVGPQTQILAFCEMEYLVGTWKRVVEKESGLGNRVGGHADIAESSLMLVLHPDLVRKEEVVAGCLEPPSEAFLERMFRDGLHSVAPNGILGDPHGMSEQIGHRCINELADTLAAYFQAETGKMDGADSYP